MRCPNIMPAIRGVVQVLKSESVFHCHAYKTPSVSRIHGLINLLAFNDMLMFQV